MKKKELLVVALLALGVTAYGNTGAVKAPEKPVPEKAAEASMAQKEVLTFTKEKGGEKVVLESSDHFETGTVTIGHQKHEVKKVASKSGIKMEEKDKKIAIHFDNEKGVLTENGKDSALKEEKK